MHFTASYKEIWSLAYPVIIGSIAQQIVTLTDAIFLGRVGDGETAMGASVLAGIWYFTLTTLGWGLSSGLQTLVARRLGEDNPVGVGVVTRHALAMGAAICLLTYIVLFAFSEPVLRTFVNSEAVFTQAMLYINWRGFDLAFFMFFVLLRGFYNGVGHNQIIIWSVGSMAAANVALNYTLIFGHFGFPEMGIAGAALASGLSQVLCLAVALGYFVWKKYSSAYSLTFQGGWDAEVFRRLATLSGPTAFQYLMSCGSFFIFLVMIEKMGPHSLGVSSLVKELYVFLMIPTWGFGTSAGVILSNLMGQGKPARIPRALVRVIRFSLAVSGIFILWLILWPEPLLALVSKNPSVVADSVVPSRLAGLALAAYSIGGILLSSVIALGASRVAFYIEVVAITSYLGYIFWVTNSSFASLNYVWGSEIVYMGVILIFSFLYLRFGQWRKIKI